MQKTTPAPPELTNATASGVTDPLAISIRRIVDSSDPAIGGFIKLYQDAFAGPPYFEAYPYDYVLDHVVTPHLPHFLAVAEACGDVVGLACGHPFMADIHADARQFLLEQPQEAVPFYPGAAVFFSELATASAVRKAGLGRRLTLAFYKWAYDNGFSHYTMRTAETGSNSRRMFERNGALLLPFVQDVSQGDIASRSERRVWLYGETSPFADYQPNNAGNQQAEPMKESAARQSSEPRASGRASGDSQGGPSFLKDLLRGLRQAFCFCTSALVERLCGTGTASRWFKRCNGSHRKGGNRPER